MANQSGPGTGRDGRVSARWVVVITVALATFVGAVTAQAVNAPGPSQPRPLLDLSRLLGPPAPKAPPAAPVAAPAPPPVPGATLLAAPGRAIPTFAGPGGAVVGELSDHWYGYDMVVPVVAQQPGWLLVRVPQRPNETTVWVRADDVTLSSTSYRMELNLSTRRLTAYNAGQVIADMPAGIGTASTPTPTGKYFISSLADPLGPGYGAFMMVTSAHSEVIDSWQGLGDAIIAIHGPISSSSDAAIGTTGTNISNGCVRLHNSDLGKLSVIPPGTPLDIFY